MSSSSFGGALTNGQHCDIEGIFITCRFVRRPWPSTTPNVEEICIACCYRHLVASNHMHRQRIFFLECHPCQENYWSSSHHSRETHKSRLQDQLDNIQCGLRAQFPTLVTYTRTLTGFGCLHAIIGRHTNPQTWKYCYLKDKLCICWNNTACEL